MAYINYLIILANIASSVTMVDRDMLWLYVHSKNGIARPKKEHASETAWREDFGIMKTCPDRRYTSHAL